MCLCGPVPTGLAAGDVLLLSHRLQVVWVHACAIATEVIDLPPSWDRADEGFIGEAVSKCDPR